jgi:hypothetical protein
VDDPFLAAYLACTKSTGRDGGKGTPTGAREPKKGQIWGFAWSRLGLGGLSCNCKTGDGVAEQSMVRLYKVPAVDHPSDA